MPAAEATADASGRGEAPGIWIFVALDCTSFALFFLVFMVERLAQPALFDQSARTLEVRLGLANTLILITSSYLVALGNGAARRGAWAAARRFLWSGLAVACGFAVLKAIEYTDKIAHGTTVLTNEFFTFYFALTGVHFLHYAVGLGALAYLAILAGREAPAADAARRLAWIDGGALYWHMVDLLWVFLFAMLYLIGAR